MASSEPDLTGDHLPGSGLWRILDANANRAREGLRVMEDYARFTLDDSTLTSVGKSLRHELQQAFSQLDAKAESGASERTSLPLTVLDRDTEKDVGKDIEVPSEYQRGDLVSVVRAAFSRTSEALRVLEEYGKLIDASTARSIEAMRYRVYEWERRLLMTAQAIERFAAVRLYVLLTESLCYHDWFRTARETVAAGVDCLQLREKSLTDRELLDRARRLSELCHEQHVLFIVNDRPDIAVLSRADGVHLGQEDVSVRKVRRALPRECLVGISTHTPQQVHAAVEEGPDYVAVGPMFPSTTKPQDHVPGPALLREAVTMTSIPCVAIGGIDVDRIPVLLDSARAGICVSAAVISHDDPASVVARMRERIAALSDR